MTLLLTLSLVTAAMFYILPRMTRIMVATVKEHSDEQV